MPSSVQVACASCKKTKRVSFEPWTFTAETARPLLSCEACGAQMEGRSAAFDAEHKLIACAACGSPELYKRKAFPKWAGIGVVVLAAIATLVLAGMDSVPRWAIYAPLFLAAAIDGLLFMTTADAVGCYRCATIHRGYRFGRELAPFDLEHAEALKRSKPAEAAPRAKPRV